MLQKKTIRENPLVFLVGVFGLLGAGSLGVIVALTILCSLNAEFQDVFQVLFEHQSPAKRCTNGLDEGLVVVVLAACFLPLIWCYRRLFEHVVKTVEEKLDKKE